jgi:hypothetical protein
LLLLLTPTLGGIHKLLVLHLAQRQLQLRCLYAIPQRIGPQLGFPEVPLDLAAQRIELQQRLHYQLQGLQPLWRVEWQPGRIQPLLLSEHLELSVEMTFELVEHVDFFKGLLPGGLHLAQDFAQSVLLLLPQPLPELVGLLKLMVFVCHLLLGRLILPFQLSN